MDRTTTNLFPSQVAAMTERDVDGLQQMKLIHKKKLTKLLKFLSENPPKPEVSEHRGRAAVHMVCNTGDLVIGMLSLDYTEGGSAVAPLGDPSGAPGCAAPDIGMTKG